MMGLMKQLQRNISNYPEIKEDDINELLEDHSNFDRTELMYNAMKKMRSLHTQPYEKFKFIFDPQTNNFEKSKIP